MISTRAIQLTMKAATFIAASSMAVIISWLLWSLVAVVSHWIAVVVIVFALSAAVAIICGINYEQRTGKSW